MTSKAEKAILEAVIEVVFQLNAIKKKTGIPAIKVPDKADLEQAVEIVGNALGEIDEDSLDAIPDELMEEYNDVCLQVSDWMEGVDGGSPGDGDDGDGDDDPGPNSPDGDTAPVGDGTTGNIQKSSVGRKGADPLAQPGKGKKAEKPVSNAAERKQKHYEEQVAEPVKQADAAIEPEVLDKEPETVAAPPAAETNQPATPQGNDVKLAILELYRLLSDDQIDDLTPPTMKVILKARA